MVDVDHFKAVNDNHGHARGDEVLRAVAKALQGHVRASDSVCRYGGEEFCILLPSTDLDAAERVAGKLREAIAAANPAGLQITASLGVSCTTLNASTAPELIDQADQALYSAKRTGRNRATRFDRIDPAVAPRSSDHERKPKADEEHIPMHAVRTLLAALSFRDPQTAEHSRRVADLCARAGSAWLDAGALSILEAAALLHDIGKVGVPDSVLLKPGPLTEEEWRIMRQHARIGVEIVQTAFDCPQLAAIISSHHTRHETSKDTGRAVAGEFVPICARLLAIADAYDAMTTNRVYRAATTREAAFAELRRCAGTQFDPLLVEHFIEVVTASTATAGDDPRSRHFTDVLRLSLEAERTATALLNRDLETTLALANHLGQVAASLGSDLLARQCESIAQSINSNADMEDLLAQARDLLNAVADQAGEYVAGSGRGIAPAGRHKKFV